MATQIQPSFQKNPLCDLNNTQSIEEPFASFKKKPEGIASNFYFTPFFTDCKFSSAWSVKGLTFFFVGISFPLSCTRPFSPLIFAWGFCHFNVKEKLNPIWCKVIVATIKEKERRRKKFEEYSCVAFYFWFALPFLYWDLLF